MPDFSIVRYRAPMAVDDVLPAIKPVAAGNLLIRHLVRGVELPLAFPVIAFSHCHNCIRFSAMSIAERLASHGFVVVAPDHTGNTMFDPLPTLDPTFLAVRAGDIRFVLDQVLDPNASAVPASLRGRLDASRVGMLGHSFGGVTTGLVVQDDPRPKAGLSIAAPMENPLLAGVDLATIQKPLSFIHEQTFEPAPIASAK